MARSALFNGVNLMASNHVFRSVLLASSVLLVGACASQPTSTAPAPSLLEMKFQRVAQNYQKFSQEGQTVYCKKQKVITSNIPGTQCVTETQLRLQVESYERSRNTEIGRPIPAGAGQGSIG